MKKFVVTVLFAMLMLSSVTVCALSVEVNGRNVDFTDGVPFVENGRTFVPLRAAAEAYGANVGFDYNLNAATVEKDGVNVTVPIGQAVIYRNGVAVDNDAPARVVDSRTYLPIRIVMEALGAQVNWIEGSQTVTVDDPDNLIIRQLENVRNTLSAGSEWNTWNTALSKMDSGSYSEAIDMFIKVIPFFKRDESANNIGLLMNNLAKCYGKLGQYHMASVCYKRASEYMYTVPGQDQQAMRFAINADEVDSSVTMYFKTNDAKYNSSTYFGAPNEPAAGTMLGKTYYSNIDELTGMPHIARLQYLDYGEEFSVHKNTYFNPRNFNGVLQIAWQPVNGLDAVQEDEYLIRQAKFLESCGCKIILRFAGEMNLPSSEWYEEPQKYIEKFRIISRVFKQYAPSVGLLWAPSFHPFDNVNSYYPGDEYVDYVGASIYGGYSLQNDPLDEGQDRSHLINLLDHIYKTYGSRKPVIIAEGGWPYVTSSGVVQEAFVGNQYMEYFTYLPIKYPNLKFVTLFDVDGSNGKFSLSGSDTVRNAYSYGISLSGGYLTSDNDGPDFFYSEVFRNMKLPAANVEICSFVTSPRNDFAGVEYQINGQPVATSVGIPYCARIDLSPYAGQTIELKAVSLGSAQAEESILINVG